MKIDVEESEIALLTGALKLVANSRPVMAIESGEWNQPKLFKLLDSVGYVYKEFAPRQVLAQPKERAVAYPPER